MSSIDVTEVVEDIRETLDSYGFKVRDADGTDYQKGTDSGLRFKVGTKYGEVTVAVYQAGRPVKYLRITTYEHLGAVTHAIGRYIENHATRTAGR